MPTEEEIFEQQKLLQAHRRTLSYYLKQQAIQGTAYVTPGVVHGIDEARTAIQRIKAILKSWSVPVENHPDDWYSAAANITSDFQATWEWLASMPVDEDQQLLTPQELPDPNRMTLHYNPLFVGRDDDLRKVAKLLRDGKEAVVISGIGGLGKTQLAVELAYRYGRFFMGGVFWVSCTDRALIRDEVAACGGPGALGLFQKTDGLTIDEQVKLVQRAWARNIPCLIIFDNCENDQVFATHRPYGHGCRILVTSRSDQWDTPLNVIQHPLNVLTRDASIALLRRHRADLSEQDADSIAHELGDLPLALHLAGSYLAYFQRVITSEVYLKQLQQPSVLEHASMQGKGARYQPTDRELHVARAFALTFDRLNLNDPIDALALALLTRVACLAPGERFLRLLLASTVSNDTDATTVEEAIYRLTALGLLETSGEDALKMHRLLVDFVRSRVSVAEAESVVEEALITIVEPLLGAGHIDRVLPFGTHLQFVTKNTEKRVDKRASILWNLLGYYFYLSGDYLQAKTAFEHALAIEENIYTSNNIETVENINNLATVVRLLGDNETARSLYERALLIREQHLGPEHPKLPINLNNLALVLRNLGELEKAKALSERALAISKKTLAPNHPQLASRLNNLAKIIEDMGDYKQAQSLYEQARTICEEQLGINHPNTIAAINNLAMLHDKLEEYELAESYYKQALTLGEAKLDPHHPQLATLHQNFGMMLIRRGDYNTAYSHIECALYIREKRLGEEHPDTQISKKTLTALKQLLRP